MPWDWRASTSAASCLGLPAPADWSLTSADVQVFSAPGQAGSLPLRVQAPLDVARFASVNQAKGHWALLDRMSWVPETAAAAAPADGAVSITLQPARSAAVKGLAAAHGRRSMPLAEVQRTVREAVVSILGSEPEGENLLRTEHPCQWSKYAQTALPLLS